MATQHHSGPWNRQGFDNQNIRDSQLRLVLVGKTGVGKSATGNSILGEKVFKAAISAKSVTKVCKKETTTWKGREIAVVDTPGIFDTEVPDADTCKEIARCIALTCPGPHALLLVVRLGRYTQEEHKATEKMLELFGEQARRHMILLFTRKDELSDTFEDFLKDAPEVIQDLMRKLSGRYCVFNNKAEVAEQEAQRAQLLLLVQSMVTENRGGYYTNEIYRMTEDMIQKQTQERQEYYRAELERETAKIRKEYEELIRHLEEKLEQQERKARMEKEIAEWEALCCQRQRNARNEVANQISFIDVILKVLGIASWAVFKLFR